MKIITPVLVASFMVIGIGQSQAAGCIKGAIIGGAAGHYLAGRGVVGAVAGCLGGRALANRQRRIDADRASRGSYGNPYNQGGYNRGGYAAPSRGNGGYVGY